MRTVLVTALLISGILFSGCQSLTSAFCPKCPECPTCKSCPEVAGLPTLPDHKILNEEGIRYGFTGRKGVGKTHIGSLFEIQFNTDGTLANKLHTETRFEQLYGRWDVMQNRLCMAYAEEKIPKECFTVLIDPRENYLLYTPKNRYMLTISFHQP